MRAIFVNHCHPDCPHVCGTRAREFANALARQGHQIVLLTETLHRDDAALDPAQLAAALEAHDWAQPFRLACRPVPAPILEALRAGRLPGPFRKLVVLYQYIRHGGMFTDWRSGSRPYWKALALHFRPDVVWGIFGNTDAWAIAQAIAREAGCPWVRDIKDQWTQFIPAPLRGLLARRFADAAGTTALSKANASNAAPWFSEVAQVVYSGVPADTLLDGGPGLPADAPLTLALIGAVYDAQSLSILVRGIERFLAAGGRDAVRIVYAGTDGNQVTAAFRGLRDRVTLDVRGQLPYAEYWQIIRAAHLNMYVRTRHDGWWHHKIVELLAARRPILCCPGEIEEARQLVARTGGRLYNCPDPAAVAAAIGAVGHDPGATMAGDAAALATLSWDARSRELLAALRPGAKGPAADAD
jgi:hypothetical protein